MGVGFAYGIDIESKQKRDKTSDERRPQIQKQRFEFPYILKSILPPKVIDSVINSGFVDIEEIRLYRNRYAYITASGKNNKLSVTMSGEEIDALLQKMCRGSLYSFKDSIINGYVTLEGGIRVGVVGKASVNEEDIIGIDDVSTLAIRIPKIKTDVGVEIVKLFYNISCRGILIYSPPGVGKTTLLRSVAYKLSTGEHPLRTAVIDSRGELFSAMPTMASCMDVLSQYPISRGIEIATRTLNPEVIICDEIANLKEAAAIITCHNSGVPLIATAHAKSFDELMKKPSVRAMHTARIFEAYVKILRDSSGDFSYKINMYGEDDLLDI